MIEAKNVGRIDGDRLQVPRKGRCGHRVPPLATIVAAAVLFLGLSAAWAGGGPENVLLVVNRDSAASRTIANHYQHWRKIPPRNVLTIPWPPQQQTTDIDTFREKILGVVLKEIDRRGLSAQIDYVVYSSDFPTGIDVGPDAREFEKRLKEKNPETKWPNPPLTTVASITGLTYLWFPVSQRLNMYFDLRANAYMRRDIPAQKGYPTLAFSAQQHFGPEGELMEGTNRRYLLSVMLGVTAGRGNTVDEVLAYLRRAAEADGTRPKGTVYFCKNGDIRSRVRDPLFPSAVRELKALGVNAEIIEGIVPIGKDDVAGAMVGAADVNLKHWKSTILPGAICEHFTSFGGIMTPGAGQTPLSDWLRAGAAGSSGTVTEPYALLDKFPVPMMHVHYARGCSLAEAFYQSVFGPYQLLIVGDPLCQPWARIPQVSIEGIKPGDTAKGVIELKPSATVAEGKVDAFELYVDELRRARCGPGGTLRFDTAQLADGWHELRVVAIENSLIRTQGRAIVPFCVDHRGRQLTLRKRPPATIKSGEPLELEIAAPGATGIVVLHNGQLAARINGSEGTCRIDTGPLGKGPIALRPIGIGATPADYLWGRPIELLIE